MLSILFTTAALEAGLRVLGIRPGIPQDGTLLMTCTIWDRRVHHRPQPNCSALMPARPDDGIPEVRVEYNSLGLRGPELGPKRKPRVLLLGDSIVQADELPLQKTMGSLLSGMMPGIEVLQAGTSSWAPFTESAWMQAYGQSMDVDRVYLFVLENDFVPASAYSLSDQAYRQWASQARVAALLAAAQRRVRQPAPSGDEIVPVPAPLRHYLTKDRTSREIAERLLLRLDPAQWDPDLRDAAESTVQSILDLARFAAGRGMRFAVVFVPLGIDVDARESTGGRAHFGLREGRYFQDAGLEHWLRARLQEEGIEMLSLTGPLRAVKRATDPASSDVLFFKFDGHLTAEGHRVAARVLREHLAADR